MNDERLNGLIETVNDTARTARTTMSWFLMAAFYLLWVLISSTDENLFLNEQLILGQLNIGLSLKNIYIIGPLILFFLHTYFLFILQELRLRTSKFELALEEIYPQNTDNKTRQILRDRISASIFVQSIQKSSNRLPRLLAFLVVVAVPLGMLFAIDLSFVRYQSVVVTLIHDTLFLTDLALVVWLGINRERWPSLYKIMKDTLIRLRTCIVKLFRKLFRRTEEQPPETYGHTEIPIPCTTLLFIVTTLLFIGASCFMVYIAVFATHPPVFDHETAEEDKNRIWREHHETGNVSRLRKIWDGILDVVFEGRNFLDAVPCKSWGIACRYLDISTRELVRMSNKELTARVSWWEFGDEDGIDQFHEDVADLNSRKFLFAKLTSTWIQGGNFIEADLRGADLQGAHLEGTKFVRAKLQGANLTGTRLWTADLARASAPSTNLRRAILQNTTLSAAQLQGADLTSADLRGANIVSARLQGADLTRADLREAVLRGTWLQGADLFAAKLQNSNLEKTQLQGARLSGALLQGARLFETNLQGANLEGARLQGANLKGAKLQGADLTRAQLQGADFANARLQGSFGRPDSWCLLWMPDASFKFPPRPRDPQGRESQYKRALSLVEKLRTKDLAWREGMSLEEHLKDYLRKGIARGVFDDNEPGKKCMVYHEPAITKWKHTPPDVNSCGYRRAWAAWTAEFACENRYTAASSLDRWLSDEPLYEAKSRFDHLADLKSAVRTAMIEREKSEECPGLSSVSKEKYREFLSARSEPPSTCESCAEQPDCAPSSRAAEAPAQRRSSSP